MSGENLETFYLGAAAVSDKSTKTKKKDDGAASNHSRRKPLSFKILE